MSRAGLEVWLNTLPVFLLAFLHTVYKCGMRIYLYRSCGTGRVRPSCQTWAVRLERIASTASLFVLALTGYDAALSRNLTQIVLFKAPRERQQSHTAIAKIPFQISCDTHRTGKDHASV